MVVVVDPSSGDVCFALASEAADVDPWAVAGDTLLTVETPLSGDDLDLVARSLTDGSEIWRTAVSYDFPRGGEMRPVGTNRGIVAAPLPEGRVGGIDIATGALRWTADQSEALIDSATTVIVSTQEGVATGLDRSTGEVRWNATPPPSNLQASVTVTPDGHAFLGTPLFTPGVGPIAPTPSLDLETGLPVTETPRDQETQTWQPNIGGSGWDLPGLGDITFGYDETGVAGGLSAWGPDGTVLWVDTQALNQSGTAGDGLVVTLAISPEGSPDSGPASTAQRGASTLLLHALDARTGVPRWSVPAPVSDAMDATRMMFTDGYVLIGGATSSN